jgi:hypothetical protein
MTAFQRARMSLARASRADGPMDHSYVFMFFAYLRTPGLKSGALSLLLLLVLVALQVLFFILPRSEDDVF